VNAVARGLSRTPLWHTLSEADRETLYLESQRIPLGRVGEVEDVARAYVYCMEQVFSTGLVLTVEGGSLLV
jgi:NAD(P)-dependent dehydrogenase (short-subunit alcohol dehydrogenase family)